MLTHVEALDGRRMASVGIKARYAFGDNVVLGDATTAANGATYVEVTSGPDTYVAKFNDALKPDRSFGDSGFARVVFDIGKLAVDAKSGAIYAAGVTAPAEGATRTLSIERLTADGNADVSFGTNGVTTYSTGVAEADGRAGSTIDLRTLTPLPKGRLLLGFTSGVTTVTGPDSVYPTTLTDYDTGLLKLRYDGSRDPAFAHNGFASLLGGMRTSDFGEHTTSDVFSDSAITDVTAYPDGRIGVVLIRRAGSTYGSDFQDQAVTNASVFIKARTLSAAGVVDNDTAYSWTLQRAMGITFDDRQNGLTFAADLAEADGRTVTVIGRPQVNGVDRLPVAYTLKPDRPPVVRGPLTFRGERITDIQRDTAGYFYAFATGEERKVRKFDNDFRPVTSWGLNGAATLTDNPVQSSFPDENGRVVFLAKTDAGRSLVALGG